MAYHLPSSLPVPLVGDPGTIVSLRSLLEKAFGREAVSEFGQLRISYESSADYIPFSYWDPEHPSVTTVLRNGKALDAYKAYTISTQDQLDAYSLRAGNLIYANVTITLKTSDTSFQDFRLQTVPGELAQKSGFDGGISPADIVAAARKLAAAEHGVPNGNDCYFIADTIAASAGAPLPNESYNFVPTENQEGGYWRIAHRGNAESKADWQNDLKAGDIVRLGWRGQDDGHSFTVVSDHNQNGTMEVVDNGLNKIAQHWTEYQSDAAPDSVTIYRLTDDGLNLINGGKAGESLWGTLWNDSIFGKQGDDTIKSGSGNDSLDGGIGADMMVGGKGDDVYTVENRGDRTVEAAREGHDRVLTTVSFAISGTHVEDVVLEGTGAINVAGNTLDNFLWGNAANNVMRGGGGDDRVNGRAGNDTLVGGAGNDKLTGGENEDLFVFEAQSGHDTITDFAPWDGDRINLTGQTYKLSQNSDGDAVLGLSGGGTVVLDNIWAVDVNPGFFV